MGALSAVTLAQQLLLKQQGETRQPNLKPDNLAHGGRPRGAVLRQQGGERGRQAASRRC